MNVLGLILSLAYRLRRHFWAAWTLARWLGLLILALGLWALISWWPNPWPPVIAGVVLILYVGLLAWARRVGYVHYTRVPDEEQRLTGQKAPLPLRKEELVPARASGWFTVEGKDQYYVDVEADFETVGTGEHIVMGRIHPSRFLVLGNWPGYELGWWYIFFQPGMIRKVDMGQLVAGPRPQWALRVVYTPDEDTEQTLYLASDDTTSLRRLWDNLLKDAPQERT